MEQTGYFIPGGGEDFFNAHRVRFADVVSNNDLSVGYTRFREMDMNELVESNTQGWRSMFARGQDVIWRWEWLWVLPFNSNFNPVNPFIDLFSNRGGSYLVKPSQAAMDKWNSQLQSNGFPFDARGNFTWKSLNGQPVITKYLYNYLDGSTLLPNNPLAKPGQWFLNRAAAVHLHFAEAANRDGRNRLALAIMDHGIPSVNPVPSGTTDVTNYAHTMYDAPPYDFDGRMGDFPRFRADWHRSAGIRGRARLTSVAVVGDSTTSIENSIIEESALELAYEGYRWPDLLRVALRRSDPAFLADKIYDKLQKDGNPQAAAVRAKLMNKDNWYLPFKFK
jgi:starch-binding outer membrane protein, SusD/RagB family